MLPERGVYLVEFRLREDHSIRVGRLGALSFTAGSYVYVGSAQSGLPQRISRHARRRKPLRWHADYLARHAPAMRAWAWEADKSAECAVARRIAADHRGVPGFGCSDCRCPSHLFICDGVAAARLAEELLGPAARSQLR